jgi:hypothetical protein
LPLILGVLIRSSGRSGRFGHGFLLGGYCDFGGRLFFGLSDRSGCSRLGNWGRWFHSTLFFLYFTDVLSGIGLYSDLRAGGGISVAPE